MVATVLCVSKNTVGASFIAKNINKGFLVLGVFISSCYYRNFSAIDLLRRPIQIIGKYNENKFYFEVPLWLPINDCFLKINNQIKYNINLASQSHIFKVASFKVRDIQ